MAHLRLFGKTCAVDVLLANGSQGRAPGFTGEQTDDQRRACVGEASFYAKSPDLADRGRMIAIKFVVS